VELTFSVLLLRSRDRRLSGSGYFVNKAYCTTTPNPPLKLLDPLTIGIPFIRGSKKKNNRRNTIGRTPRGHFKPLRKDLWEGKRKGWESHSSGSSLLTNRKFCKSICISPEITLFFQPREAQASNLQIILYLFQNLKKKCHSFRAIFGKGGGVELTQIPEIEQWKSQMRRRLARSFGNTWRRTRMAVSLRRYQTRPTWDLRIDRRRRGGETRRHKLLHVTVSWPCTSFNHAEIQLVVTPDWKARWDYGDWWLKNTKLTPFPSFYYLSSTRAPFLLPSYFHLHPSLLLLPP